MAEKKIRDLGGNTCKYDGKRKRMLVRNTLYLEFKNLLMNAIEITNTDYNDEILIKDCLIEDGCVGYDKITDKWCTVYGAGVDERGNPTVLNFEFKNGVSFTRKAYYDDSSDGAYIINGTPDKLPVGLVILESCEKIANCDIAIKQNLDACKTPFVAVVKSRDIQLSLEHAIEDKEDGKPVMIVDDNLADALKGVSFETQYIVDKLAEYQSHERDLLLNKLGIMSANVDKRERVQVGEVNATLGQCIDYIYLMIDTFNKQCKTYGIDKEMRLNGAIEELYTNVDESEENIDKEGEDAIE